MSRHTNRTKTDLKDAMSAIDRVLGDFDIPTAALAVSAFAGVLAAQATSDVKGYAALGVNIERMTAAFIETRNFRQVKKRLRKNTK